MPSLTPRAYAGSICQGAILEAVPIIWVTSPLWLIRPKNRPLEGDAHVERASEVRDAFRSDAGEETVLGRAKARPAVVISSWMELRGRDIIRVAPLYSFHSGTWAERNRERIVDRQIPSHLHVTGSPTLHEGYIRLDNVTVVPFGILGELSVRVVGRFDGADTALLLTALASYIQA